MSFIIKCQRDVLPVWMQEQDRKELKEKVECESKHLITNQETSTNQTENNIQWDVTQQERRKNIKMECKDSERIKTERKDNA